ncbi:endothelin-1 [Eublepharis macularius]|uniref:Endothelin-1 n=1 Tax=Eublepharis macularius TaxID=481883 RepID=A0AA97L3L0_EUBMA|nr:endothelin-1 [Eublepharis macularius]
MDYARRLLPLVLVLCQGARHAAASEAQPGAADKPPSSAPWPPRRSKRCSCSSLEDKECVYFCHLDIIWINTPERIVPYGLGGPSRTRRSLEDFANLEGTHERCQCADLKDKKCRSFCQNGKQHGAQSTREKGWKSLPKDRACKGLTCAYMQLVNSKKMRRLEAIGNKIKASFNAAKLRSRLHKRKQLKHNRTYRKQNVWESLKMTS